MNRNKFVKIGIASLLILTLVAATFLGACGSKKSGSGKKSKPTTQEKQVETKGTFRLVTTTSTKESGLLEYLLPVFQKSTGWKAKVVYVEPAEALALGKKGEADALLVHSPADDDKFITEKNADDKGRVQVMYNDFVLIGPKADPAGVNAAGANDAVKAFKVIAGKKATFISRGDKSAVHAKEQKIWETAAIKPAGKWYTAANAGMTDVITTANKKPGYTLADRATWLAKQKGTDLKIVSEKDPSGIYNNQYSVICVNPEKNAQIKHDGATAFQEWMASPDGQKAIGEFGVKKYGQQVFTPNAKKAK
ncbi:MAG: substrate-binding domain-containing protein [Clostridiales Family XIII bacterium]|jgi:tungstate transport system substrate-binding protein|nr:substrate-binding domain-containing protein [Clostridiales Family XIII bacterium]